QPKSRQGSRFFARAFENGVYDYRLKPLTWAWVKSAKRLYLVNGHRRTSSILSAKVDSVKLSNQIIEVEDENELLDIFYKFDTELAKRTPTQL
ncbi:hypothetical protein ACI394_28240, partial [Klebsiella pneumoniae]|uniref:hypothetical protein n=1 Tax=Klebsiella pneumoniae TaxID=573 RepID=UPI0038536B95